MYIHSYLTIFISGQVVGETAKTLSERFGNVLRKRQSISINRQDVSHSFNTQMDRLIPPSKISLLTQGMFVGAVSDNFDERIEQKIFHADLGITEKRLFQSRTWWAQQLRSTAAYFIQFSRKRYEGS